MLALILAALLVPAVIGFFILRSRLARLEWELSENSRRLQWLTSRVYTLEQQGRPAPPVASAMPSPVPELTTEPQSAPPELPLEPRPARPEAETPRNWESIIGGNLLGKFGMLVLVVGVGLFLAYSLTHLGPAAKIAIGFAVGLSMLATGAVLEQRPGWSTFGRGFLGGGWAAVYFTTYAMHGLDAARIIDSPTLATALLLGVSALMVLHSLRYRSEAVTGLAYLISFVTLNLGPLTGFTVVASIILAAALLLAAWRFQWYWLGLAGVVLTYGTFGILYEPAVFGRAGVLNGQVVLWIYWILFEAFDLLDLGRRGRDRGAEKILFALNTAGFLAASALHQWRMDAADWGVYFSFAAAVYASSALLRRYLLAPRQEDGNLTRLASGGYEQAAFVATGMASAAIVEFLTGIRASAWLFALAEILVLAGLFVKDGFISWLGQILFLAPLFRLPLHTGTVTLGGREFKEWTPLAGFMAVTFYANRFLAKSGAAYPVIGSLLLLAVSWVELPAAWVAPVWGAGLAGMIALSRLTRRPDDRWQAYGLAALIAMRVLFAPLWVLDREPRIISGVIALAILFAAHYMLRSQFWIAPLAALNLAVLLDAELRNRLVTMSWGIEAVALVAAGFLLRDRSSRLSGLAGFLLCVGRLFFHDLQSLDTIARILSFIVLGLLLLGASWVYTRYREQIRRYL